MSSFLITHLKCSVQQGLGVVELVAELAGLDLEPLVLLAHVLQLDVGAVQLLVQVLQLARVGGPGAGAARLAMRAVTVPLALLPHAAAPLLVKLKLQGEIVS